MLIYCQIITTELGRKARARSASSRSIFVEVAPAQPCGRGMRTIAYLEHGRMRSLATQWAHLAPKHIAAREPEITNPVLVECKGMGDIVNFRKARKRVERKLDEHRAIENRVRHGRGKAERALQIARKAKSRREL